MKKIIYIVALLAGLSSLAGCSDDNYYITEVTNVYGSDSTQNNDSSSHHDSTLDSVGTAERPTDWVSITDVDPTAFMLLMLDSTDVPATINPDDILAAFIGNVCVGMNTPETDNDGVTRFDMVISRPAETQTESNDTSDSNIQVELRYFSKNKKRIYIADKFNFVPGKIYDDYHEDYRPTWR